MSKEVITNVQTKPYSLKSTLNLDVFYPLSLDNSAVIQIFFDR